MRYCRGVLSPAVPPASIKAEDTPQAVATVLPSVTTTTTMAAVVAAEVYLAVRFRGTKRAARVEAVAAMAVVVVGGDDVRAGVARESCSSNSNDSN